MTSSGQGLNNICVLYDTIYLLSRYKILVLTLINHSLLIFKPFIVFLGSFSLCTGNLKIVVLLFRNNIRRNVMVGFTEKCQRYINKIIYKGWYGLPAKDETVKTTWNSKKINNLKLKSSILSWMQTFNGLINDLANKERSNECNRKLNSFFTK